MESKSTSNLFADAVKRHQAGDLDGAEVLYRQILGVEPDQANVIHLLGVLARQRGRYDLAVEWIQRAISLNPTRADYRNSLGVVFRAQGRIAEAIEIHRQALGLDPHYPDAWANLGVELHEQGHFGEARSALAEALRLAPNHVNAVFGLANLLQDLGETASAVSHYQRAHDLAPQRSDILNNWAIALATGGDAEGALSAAHQAVTAHPTEPAFWTGLGQALQRMDRVEEAGGAYVEAGRLRPEEGHWSVRIAALCPAVFVSAEAIDQYRRELETVLDAHQVGQGLSPSTVVTSGCLPSFHLAHHGRDDRVLKSKFAALFRDVFPVREPVTGSGPFKIGFVATQPTPGMFLRCTGGIIDRLDPNQFRIVLFGRPAGLAAMRAALQRSDVEFVSLTNDLPASALRVAAARCDVLYHWQVGTDPLAYFLPFTRPAPIQCTSWGTHVTSGVPAIAHYLSSELIEPDNGERYYTEALVRMTTLPTYQNRISQPNAPSLRSEFGLSDGAHLYSCLQRLAKIHPDFDPILAEILRRDPAGLILLFEDDAVRSTERLRHRLAITMPDVADRVVFLRRRSRESYLRLLSLSDAVLDPLHYGAGATSYDTLGLNLPLVTLPGVRHVGRYALGCYRKLGWEGLVAGSSEIYVELAVRLGTDPDFRVDAMKRIAATAPLLFDDAIAVTEHAAFFERAAIAARNY